MHGYMEHHCQRCNRFTMGSAYRVTNREFGVMRLDMIVCYECYLDARRLGLDTEKIRLRDSVSDRTASKQLDCAAARQIACARNIGS